MKTSRKRDGTAEHRYVEERLSAYLDGQLPPREHKAVRQHLATCQECQWNLSTLQQTVRWTRALPQVPAPRVFAVPAPVQAVSAPRRRWGFVPPLQGAAALVALLLVFTLAGDFVLSGLLPASVPQQAVMLDQAPAAVQVTVVVEEMEEEAMAEMAASEPIPSTMPQTNALTAEPALGEAEQPQLEAGLGSDDERQAAEKAAWAATAASAEEPAQAMAVEPPGAGDSEVMAEREAVEAPATVSPEATDMEGAGAARTGGPETPTVATAPPPAEPPPVAAPTAIAQAPAPAPMIPEAPEGKTSGLLWQPSASSLHLLEVVLALLVVFLGSVAIIATILQRRLR